MDDDAPVTPAGRPLDPAAFTWRFSRASGPGGQHVNTTESRVELVCDVARLGLPAPVTERVIAALGSTVRVVAAAERSQRRNRAAALERLGRQIDAAAHVARPRRATRPGKGAVERRLTSKKHAAHRKAERRWRHED